MYFVPGTELILNRSQRVGKSDAKPDAVSSKSSSITNTYESRLCRLATLHDAGTIFSTSVEVAYLYER